MTRERLVIVGAGLCGSLLAARLRHRFQVVVVEPGRKPRPLTDEISCDAGAVNTTINRASGLGGTTNYWHNALIELDQRDLLACGLDPHGMRRWYDAAWRIFLDDRHLAVVSEWARSTGAALPNNSGTSAQMVVPQRRSNMWALAQEAFPGDPVEVVEARVHSLEKSGTDGRIRVTLDGSAQRNHIEADHVLVCAGGLGTPVVLAHTFQRYGVVNGGVPRPSFHRVQPAEEQVRGPFGGAEAIFRWVESVVDPTCNAMSHRMIGRKRDGARRKGATGAPGAVEGPSVDTPTRAPYQLFGPREHLLRGSAREREEQDALRARALEDEVRHPVRERTGLAGPRPGDDEQRARPAGRRLPLPGVQLFECRRRRRHPATIGDSCIYFQ